MLHSKSADAICYFAEESRPAGHKPHKDEFLVPDETEEFDESLTQSHPDSVDELPHASPAEEEEEQHLQPYAPEEEEEDDIPDAGAIEEEASEESDASMAAPSEHASSSSNEDALVSNF